MPCDPCQRDCEPQETPDCLDLLWPKLEMLKVCLGTELEKSVAGAPCRLAIVSGVQAVFDDCCSGTAWVRAEQVYSSSAFPTPDSSRDRCKNLQQAAVVEVGVVRCAPTMNDHGEAPTVEQLEQSAREVHSDRVRLFKALRCCFSEEIGCDDTIIGAWQALPEGGGCVGGQVSITFTLSQYGCECECDEDGELVQVDG